MKCKCFDKNVSFKPTDSFNIRLNKSKCCCTSRFTVEERKSSFSICCSTTRFVDKYKIDGYFDSDATHKKCDYLFIYHHTNRDTFIFVELKGEDIKRAFKQLDNTISIFDKEKFFAGMKGFELIGAIVFTRNPADDATIRKLKKGIYEKFKKYNLQIESKKFNMRYDPRRNKFLGIKEK